MSDYRLLAVDLDGTLTNSRKEVSAHTLCTLLAAQERGLRIVISSGRPTYGIAPIAHLLQLSRYGGFVMSYNGSQITDWCTGQVLHSQTLSPTIYHPLYRYSQGCGLAMMCYDGDRVISEDCTNPYVVQLSERNRMRLHQVPSLLHAIGSLQLPKLIIVGDPERLVPLESEIRDDMRGQINVFRSDPFILELVPEGIDKGASLSRLTDYIGIKAQQVIACGDGFNDITMIQYAGLGVAMENAHPLVKAAASLITLSNDNDGVAAVVNQFFV